MILNKEIPVRSVLKYGYPSASYLGVQTLYCSLDSWNPWGKEWRPTIQCKPLSSSLFRCRGATFRGCARNPEEWLIDESYRVILFFLRCGEKGSSSLYPWMKSWSVKALHAEVPFVMLWMVDRALEFVNKFRTCFHFKWKLLSSFYVFNVLLIFLSEVVTSVFLISHHVPNVVIQHFVTVSTYYRQGAINIRRACTTNNST